MQTKYIDENIVYDGSQLKSHWILDQTHLFGDAIVSFSGVCDVKLDQMVDLEDVINQQPIYSTNMLHFLIEHFDDNLKSAIFKQRLLISIIKDLLVLKTNQSDFIRKGDDIYWGEDKLTVSIATKSLVSTLIHTGVNISSKNTPVPTKGLEDFKISAKEFSLMVMNQYQQEILSTNQALVKVRAVS